MDLWQQARGEFVDVIDWSEDGSDTLVWRFPREGNAIKWGAQLIVREGQQAVLVNEGRVADCFTPGRYRLETRNLPILTSLLALPTAFESPFKAEVLFVATRQFTDRKWGTRHPLILRDPELGPVRLRGFGSYCLRASDPVRLIRELSGSNARFSVEAISEQLRNLIVSRLADLLGESEHPVLDLAAQYDELAGTLQERLAQEWAGYGLTLSQLLIENLSLPAEVEAAIDRRAAIGLTGDLAAFRTYQEGIALEKAAENPAGGAAAGAGLAMGFGLGERLAPPPPPPPLPPPPPPAPASAPPADPASDDGASGEGQR
jgi:membrane protease subunit (stomatin/prohibitin family)